MFRAMISPIFMSTRLCVTAFGIMHPRFCRPVADRKHRGCISAPEDGQNNCPKHVEPNGIINKPLLVHLVGCPYYLYQWCTVKQISDNEIYLLIKYIKSVLWRVAKRLSYVEDARCLKVNLNSWQLMLRRRNTKWHMQYNRVSSPFSDLRTTVICTGPPAPRTPRLVGPVSEPSKTSLLTSPITCFTFVNKVYLWPTRFESYTWKVCK